MAQNSIETVPVDPEAWEIAFKPYAEHQHANSAYDLARKLMAVKQCLLTQPPEVSLAAATLDEACDALFPFSEFHKAGYDLFRLAIEGRTSRADENLMDGLGIKYRCPYTRARNRNTLPPNYSRSDNGWE